jgi:hypothetical protein
LVVDKKPADAKSILKGPFATKDEANKALKASETSGPSQQPASNH